MPSKYYKFYAEGLNGEEGHYYCEVTNEEIVRQIFSFGAELYWATPEDENDERYFFTDQPEFLESDLPIREVARDFKSLTESEFLCVWNAALKKVY